MHTALWASAFLAGCSSGEIHTSLAKKTFAACLFKTLLHTLNPTQWATTDFDTVCFVRNSQVDVAVGFY